MSSHVPTLKKYEDDVPDVNIPELSPPESDGEQESAVTLHP